MSGLVHDPDEVYTEYPDPAHDSWHLLVLPVLKQMKRSALAETTGLSRRAVAALRNGHALPRTEHRDELTRAAADFARGQLKVAGQKPPCGDFEACAAWLTVCT